MSSIQDDVTYHLRNEESLTYMELDADEREVGASPWNNWLNQKWIFIEIRDHVFHIKSAKNHKFLAPSVLGPGQQLIVIDNPYEWDVKDESPTDSTLRLFPAQDTTLCTGLKVVPPPAPAGTPVELQKYSPFEKRQIWKKEKDL